MGGAQPNLSKKVPSISSFKLSEFGAASKSKGGLTNFGDRFIPIRNNTSLEEDIKDVKLNDTSLMSGKNDTNIFAVDPD